MTARIITALLCLLVLGVSQASAHERGGEYLDRGLVAMARDRGEVYVGWRLLRTDPEDIGFNVYRHDIFTGETVKVNDRPVTASTNYLDDSASPGSVYRYHVRPVVDGAEGEKSKTFFCRAWPFSKPYVQILMEGDGYAAYNVTIGDLDGDGAYDYVIKQPQVNTDPWREPGYWRRSRDTYKLEAYSSEGKFMWRYDMGWAIEAGTWYSPYIVYDVDGDGRAEMYCKGGPGDPREIDGQVISGPEYLVKVDGMTGEIEERRDWLDRSGYDTMSHVTRNFLTVAYLDGKLPSLIMQRGTYTIIKTLAMNSRLEKIWYWEASGEYEDYRGQGQHGLISADIDGDGRDELVIGSAALDDDGAGMWTTGLGHPDVGYVGDMDPDRPGMEIFYGIEPRRKSGGLAMADARTGELIWSYDGPTTHVHSQGMAGDIDPDHPGVEFYAGESDRSQFWLYAASGERLSDKPFGDNVLAPRAIWWDDDPQKEIECEGRIFDYKGETIDEIEGKVIGIGDVLGDWREEIITSLDGEIRIYSTTVPASTRRTCLMQDRQYRLGVTASSMGYFYPPQVGGIPMP